MHSSEAIKYDGELKISIINVVASKGGALNIYVWIFLMQPLEASPCEYYLADDSNVSSWSSILILNDAEIERVQSARKEYKIFRRLFGVDK